MVCMKQNHNARYLILIALMAFSTRLSQAATDQSGLMAWPVDSMQKIFKDVVPPAEATNQVVIEAARNEVISAQVVAWCKEPMEKLACRASPLKLAAGQPIPAPRVRWVGYVPVGMDYKGTGNPKKPFPDPLLETAPGTIEAGTPQPIWLTYKIPADTAPGLYQGEVVVEATLQGKVQAINVPLRIQVYAATLPDTRTLKVSNWTWFDNGSVAKLCGVDEVYYSEPYWKLMESVAQNMAAHRQNVIFTPMQGGWSSNDLIIAKVNPQGKLELDFTQFDRWVTIFRAAGVDGLIEGVQLARPNRGSVIVKDGGFFKSVAWKIEDGKAVRVWVGSLSEEYDQYLAFYLTALQKHLEEKGWLKNYVQHVYDEPQPAHAETYNLLAKKVKKYAPWVRIIDAVSTEKVLESVDIMVPLYGAGFTPKAVAERERVKEKELWFYTCIAQSPLNRFISEPLTHPRLLHWVNFQTKTTGYLHWGFNWWIYRKDPIKGNWKLRPGDEWLVYPKPGGVLDSIRYEAMLEGLQDHELLVTLAARDAKAAERISKAVGRNSKKPKEGTGPNRDSVEALRDARRELLKALSN
jgi:hypothetical protein